MGQGGNFTYPYGTTWNRAGFPYPTLIQIEFWAGQGKLPRPGCSTIGLWIRPGSWSIQISPKGEQLLGEVAELWMYESIHQASNSNAHLYAHVVAH